MEGGWDGATDALDGAKMTEREWLITIVTDEVRIRCRYQRQGHRILEYTVQLEIRHQGRWEPIIRFDNAHGFCPCGTIHGDGTQEKTPVSRGDANSNFTWAIKELRMNWPTQRSRFLAEVKA